MFVAIGSEATTEIALSAAIVVLIISVLANLAFIQSIFFSKSKERSFKSKLPEFIQKYLKEQAEKTQNIHKYKDKGHIQAGVIKLRSAYLAIEAKGIERGIDSDEYWNLLNSNLQKLFSLLTEQPKIKALSEAEEKIAAIRGLLAHSPRTPATIKVLQSLDKFRLACIAAAEHPQKLAAYNEKLSLLFLKISNVDFRNLSEKSSSNFSFQKKSEPVLQKMQADTVSSERAIEHFSHHHHTEIAEKGSQLQLNNKALRNNIEDFRESIGDISENIDLAQKEAILTQSKSLLSGLNTEINDLSEQLLAASDKEVERLKAVISNQKQLIKDLEMALDNLEEKLGKDAIAEDRTQIEALKRSLNEAETCIVMLEYEIEEIKTQNKAIDSPAQGTSSEPSLGSGTIENLQQTIDKLENELSETKGMEKRFSSLLSFVRECDSASTIEDVSLLVHQTFVDLDLNASLLIYGNSRTLEVSASGKLDARDKLLINNMRTNEINASSQRLNFRFANLGGNVQVGKSKEFSDFDKELTLDLLRLTDKVITRLKNAESKNSMQRSLSDFSNDMKIMINEVDRDVEGIIKHSGGIIREGFAQLQDIARAKGMSATQIASFKNMEKAALEELESDARTRLKMKKTMLTLLNKIESKQ